MCVVVNDWNAIITVRGRRVYGGVCTRDWRKTHHDSHRVVDANTDCNSSDYRDYDAGNIVVVECYYAIEAEVVAYLLSAIRDPTSATATATSPQMKASCNLYI